LQFDVTAFAVELGHAEAADHPVRFRPRKYGDTAITLALCVVVMTVIAVGPEIAVRELGFLRLGFLQAHDIR